MVFFGRRSEVGEGGELFGERGRGVDDGRTVEGLVGGAGGIEVVAS